MITYKQENKTSGTDKDGIGDNFKGQLCLCLHKKTYVMGTHNHLTEAILMSTHYIGFYGELTKIILQLSSNTPVICSTELKDLPK